MLTHKIKKPIVLFAAALAIAGFFSASALADNGNDVQDAINKAGFGGGSVGATDTTSVKDPHANASNGGATSGGSSSWDYAVGMDYNLHTYMSSPNLKIQFKSYGEDSPLPTPDAVTGGYDYGKIFQRQQHSDVMGMPPAASDGRVSIPSEPSWYDKDGNPTKDHPMSVYRYSGDRWGDCLGPKCTDHGSFREPIGSWVQFTEIGTTRADQFYNLVGFNDTLIQLSQHFGGQAYELKGDKQ